MPSSVATVAGDCAMATEAQRRAPGSKSSLFLIVIFVFSFSHHPPRFKVARGEPLCPTARSVGPGFKSRRSVREEIHLWVYPQRLGSRLRHPNNRAGRASDFGAVLSHCGDCRPYFVVLIKGCDSRRNRGNLEGHRAWGLPSLSSGATSCLYRSRPFTLLCLVWPFCVGRCQTRPQGEIAPKRAKLFFRIFRLLLRHSRGEARRA